MNLTNKAKAWAALCGAIIATGGAWAVGADMKAGAESLIAQEAEEAVDKAFEKKVAPLTIQFRRKIELDRRRDDRAEHDLCMRYRTEFAEGEQRKRRCDKESDYRWSRWAWQDCVDLRGEDHPACVKPEPPHRVPSQRREP